MTCPRCNEESRESERICQSCGKDLGFPNVRACNDLTEKKALDERYKAALSVAGKGSYMGVLVEFQDALKSSKAVICRSISKVKDLIFSDNELYATFYQLVGAGARRPEKNIADRERLVADDLLFPHYRHEIRFAALSLDGLGATFYGNCSMVMKDIAISDRATVFEENSLNFCKTRDLGVNRHVPPGYRALWNDRELLGCAKLYSQLDSKTERNSFAKIVLSGGDFMEVHIYGSLHRGSLEHIVVEGPLTGPDALLLSEIKRIIKEGKLPITVEEKA